MRTKEHIREALLAINRTGGITKKELAEILQVSTPKAAEIIEILHQKSCITQTEGESNGGRIPKMYMLSEGCGYLLGVDIGTEFIRLGIVSPSGELKGAIERRFDIDTTRELSEGLFSEMLQNVYQKSGISSQSIVGVGIGITGIIHERKGVCLSLRNTPKWKGLHVVNLFKHLCDTDHVMLTDSVKAMAVAERMFGQAGSLDNYIVVNIGIGLGAGIVINGELLDGNRGTTGEIGHMHIRPSQTLCVCGNYGCLESIASGWAILKKCKNAIREGVETRIGREKELRNINVQDIIEAADHGDKIAITLLESTAIDLGIGIGSVINLLNPQRIFLAGGLIQHGQNHMYGQLVRGVKSAVIPWLQETIDIEVSKLDQFSVVRGVSIMTFEKLVATGFAHEENPTEDLFGSEGIDKF
jgi:predicted NBD/HSP70 family sugar kinase